MRFVQSQVGLGQFQFQQVLPAGQVQRARFRQYSLPLFEQVSPKISEGELVFEP